MYFDEDLLLDIRLNSLNKFVKKLILKLIVSRGNAGN